MEELKVVSLQIIFINQDNSNIYVYRRKVINPNG